MILLTCDQIFNFFVPIIFLSNDVCLSFLKQILDFAMTVLSSKPRSIELYALDFAFGFNYFAFTNMWSNCAFAFTIPLPHTWLQEARLCLSQISLVIYADYSLAIIICLIMVIAFANNLRIFFVAAVSYPSIKAAKHYDDIMWWLAFYCL